MERPSGKPQFANPASKHTHILFYTLAARVESIVCQFAPVLATGFATGALEYAIGPLSMPPGHRVCHTGHECATGPPNTPLGFSSARWGVSGGVPRCSVELPGALWSARCFAGILSAPVAYPVARPSGKPREQQLFNGNPLADCCWSAVVANLKLPAPLRRI